MLINLSNHPYATWSDDQKNAAAEEFGEVIDMPFPAVSPSAEMEEVSALADECFTKIRETGRNAELLAVHLAGEFTLVYQILTRLHDAGITTVAATSERMVELKPDGSKLIKFRFVKFRRYFP